MSILPLYNATELPLTVCGQTALPGKQLRIPSDRLKRVQRLLDSQALSYAPPRKAVSKTPIPSTGKVESHPAVIEEPARESLHGKTYAELRALARERGIGAVGVSKAQLVVALSE